MDNFMDKLAQKWNAGELIKANSAAEAMELKRLQEQVAEYEEILQEMRKLNLKNVELMEASKQLVEEGIGEVASILQQKKDEKDEGDYKQLVDEIIDKSEEFVHKENVKVYRNVQAVVVDGLKEQTEELVKQNKVSWESVKGLRLIVCIIMGLVIGNIGLTIAQIAGLL